ncbi:unnamed protein product [Paramecium sonneborni]|uniref:Uncharacterized protein n=1 Tax=Paramecium sonneborni TaxID=65129 RepID=A0A8S1KLI9_9CILI|nr:unnamed protein product [Paramecium sonneborni]
MVKKIKVNEEQLESVYKKKGFRSQNKTQLMKESRDKKFICNFRIMF